MKPKALNNLVSQAITTVPKTFLFCIFSALLPAQLRLITNEHETITVASSKKWIETKNFPIHFKVHSYQQLSSPGITLVSSHMKEKRSQISVPQWEGEKRRIVQLHFEIIIAFLLVIEVQMTRRGNRRKVNFLKCFCWRSVKFFLEKIKTRTKTNGGGKYLMNFSQISKSYCHSRSGISDKI